MTISTWHCDVVIAVVTVCLPCFGLSLVCGQNVFSFGWTGLCYRPRPDLLGGFVLSILSLLPKIPTSEIDPSSLNNRPFVHPYFAPPPAITISPGSRGTYGCWCKMPHQEKISREKYGLSDNLLCQVKNGVNNVKLFSDLLLSEFSSIKFRL